MSRYDAYTANQAGQQQPQMANYQPETANYRDQYYEGPTSSNGHSNQPWTPAGAYGANAGAQNAPYDFSRNNQAMDDAYDGEMVEPSAMRTSGGGYQAGGFGPISGGANGYNGDIYDEEEEREPWYRRTKGTVIFLVIAAVAAIIALAVGLGVGLSMRRADSDADAAAAASSASTSSAARTSSAVSQLPSIRTFTSEIITTVPVSTSAIPPRPTTSLAPLPSTTTTSTSTTPTSTSSRKSLVDLCYGLLC